MGDRFTRDTGSGYVWHLGTTVSFTASDSLTFKIEGDFKRLVASDRSHGWNQGDGTPAETWSGAKIWSDQQSIAGFAEYRF
jgi:hypothetical protein